MFEHAIKKNPGERFEMDKIISQFSHAQVTTITTDAQFDANFTNEICWNRSEIAYCTQELRQFEDS